MKKKKSPKTQPHLPDVKSARAEMRRCKAAAASAKAAYKKARKAWRIARKAARHAAKAARKAEKGQRKMKATKPAGRKAKHAKTLRTPRAAPPAQAATAPVVT